MRFGPGRVDRRALRGGDSRGARVAATLDLADRVYLTGELDGVTTVLREQAVDDISLRAALTVRGNVPLGRRWQLARPAVPRSLSGSAR